MNFKKKCKQCSKTFETNNNKKKYCSTMCRYKYNSIVKSSRYVPKQFTKKCEFCGCNFTKNKSHIRFCDVYCMNKARYKREREERARVKGKMPRMNHCSRCNVPDNGVFYCYVDIICRECAGVNITNTTKRG